MAKTRNRTKLLAANNAKTRAGNSKTVNSPLDKPVPDALSRDLLKEGWVLLKRYIDNSASVDDVDEFLKVAKEPELVQAFSDITGCEPEDHTRQADLASKVASKIAELEKSVATQPGMFSILTRRI